MKTIEKHLSDEIESSVERIVAASHSAAVATLDHAFNRSRKRAGRAAPGKENMRNAGRSNVQRRSREHIAALGQQLLEAVHSEPGQTMSILAAQVGVQASQFQVPVARLKSAGKIRTAGSRQFTRYFPVEETE